MEQEKTLDEILQEKPLNESLQEKTLDEILQEIHQNINYQEVDIDNYAVELIQKQPHILITEDLRGHTKTLAPIMDDIQFSFPNGQDVVKVTAGNFLQLKSENKMPKAVDVIARQDVVSHYRIKDELLTPTLTRRVQEMFMSTWHRFHRMADDCDKMMDLTPQECQADLQAKQQQYRNAAERVRDVFMVVDQYDDYIHSRTDELAKLPQCPSGRVRTLNDVKALIILGTDPEHVIKPQDPEFTKLVTNVANSLPGWTNNDDHDRGPRELER